MAVFSKPFQLLPLFRERVWGRSSLAPYFPTRPANEHIGEVWFTFEENRTSLGKSLGSLLRESPELLGSAADLTHPGICPILVKLLFTTERLSVQVHPDDAYAQVHHRSLGKTEAWYVLDAEDPGEVAVGFKQPLDAAKLVESAKSGEIVDLLDWRKVKRGDIIFTPAGTVHAIGAGVTICEIQENSDITYRLYDYGRPRELHLEHGARVSRLSKHNEDEVAVPLGEGRDQLVACPYFRIERFRPTKTFLLPSGLSFYVLAICVSGSGELDGHAVRAGEAWFVPANSETVEFKGQGSEWIITYASSTHMADVSVN